MNDIKNNFENVLKRVSDALVRAGRQPDETTIVAVSKTHPIETIISGISAGINIFGENYVQELKDKYDLLNEKAIPQPEWHFIGHLQRNKVKYIIKFVSMIHSVDSLRLAEEISKQAENSGIEIKILLQINTSGEASKFGCEPGKAEELLGGVINLKNIKVEGLMTIGSFSEDENIYRKEFRLLKSLKEKLQRKFPTASLRHLSMGMTHDFEAAIEEGATIVRIGTAIFGERDYGINKT